MLQQRNVKSTIPTLCVFSAFLAFFLLSFPTMLEAKNSETQAKENVIIAMQRLLNNPENLVIKMEGFSQKEQNFYYKKVKVIVNRATFDGLILDQGEIIFTDLLLDRQELITKQRIEVKSSGEIFLDMKILEQDLNNYVNFKKEKIKVKNPKIVLENKHIELSGGFRWKIGSITFNALGELDVLDNKINFHPKRFKVNRMNLPPYVIKRALRQINPILDMAKFPFKVTLRRIDIQDKVMVLSSYEQPRK
jgi:hypothetical protein